MLAEGVSPACPPALTSSSSVRPLTRKGTSSSSDSPPAESASTRGEMMAGLGGAVPIAAPAVTEEHRAARSAGRSVTSLAEQRVEVERVGHAELDAALRCLGPFFGGPVPGQLEPDAVRIGEVDRDAHPVIRSALNRNPRGEHPMHRSREIGPGWIADGDVVEPGVPVRRRVRPAALPGVEPQVVVVITRGDERGAVAIPSHQVEAEYAAIEPDGAVEVAHLEVYVPNAGGGGDPVPGRWFGHTRGVGWLAAHPPILGSD